MVVVAVGVLRLWDDETPTTKVCLERTGVLPKAEVRRRDHGPHAYLW